MKDIETAVKELFLAREEQRGAREARSAMCKVCPTQDCGYSTPDGWVNTCKPNQDATEIYLAKSRSAGAALRAVLRIGK